MKNIVYLHTHDTGTFIEPYGYRVQTPNLLKLARDGVLFRHAYNAAPTCSPSRSALMTGMAPHSCGMLGLAHRGFRLSDYSRHLVRFLNGHGYETALSGVQHEGPIEEIGYGKVLEGVESKNSAHKDLATARAAADYLKQPKDKPFFLSVGFFNTHREFPERASDIDPDFVAPPFPLADTPENREDMAAYMTSVRVMDDCVGIVLDALREAGLEGDTLVIFSTDHGIAFPHMKCNLYDTGIRIALLMKFPEPVEKRFARDALVSQIDLFPTLCDYIGVEKPDWLQGRSLMPLLDGSETGIRDELFAEVTFHAAYEPMRCVRTRRYKLIRFYEETAVPTNIDDGPSKSFLLDHGYLKHCARERELLFDLYLDPVERVNLASASGYESVYRDLSERLDRWMRETDDPLLNGKVAKPEGALVNAAYCISPREQQFE